MLFDIPFIADWQKIEEHRQRLTDLNNTHENKGRIDYDYKVGQKVPLRKERYSPQHWVQLAQKTLAHSISPYEWNNHGSTQKQNR
jgi:hypothetical protein